MRRRAKPARAEVEAKLPPARTSRKREDLKVRDLEKRLAEALGREAEAQRREAEALRQLQTRDRELVEALEQQTATSEILGVISRSPTDIQPVLDTVARSAMRLCAAYDAIILRMDGGVLRRVAHHGPIPPLPNPVYDLTRDTVAGRIILDRRTIHLADLQAETEEFPIGSKAARRAGSRTVLGVPLLRESVAIGAIYLRRMEVQPFSASQVALLETFADQAVIAIENVRLFTEVQEKNQALTTAHAQVTEALERQTATSEILRVISSSPTDVQPVFETSWRGQYGSAGRSTGTCSASMESSSIS